MHTVKEWKWGFNVINQTTCVGVILAGGQSRRMGGGDKCLLPINGKSILQRTIERAKSQVSTLLFNCNGDKARFNFIGLPLVKDIWWVAWPIGRHTCQLSWMATYQPDAEWLVSCSGYTSFFPENLAKKLLQRAQGNNYEVIVAMHKNEIQPLFALWNISLLSKLEEHLHNNGNPKMQAWIKLSAAYVRRVWKHLSRSLL